MPARNDEDDAAAAAILDGNSTTANYLDPATLLSLSRIMRPYATTTTTDENANDDSSSPFPPSSSVEWFRHLCRLRALLTRAVTQHQQPVSSTFPPSATAGTRTRLAARLLDALRPGVLDASTTSRLLTELISSSSSTEEDKEEDTQAAVDFACRVLACCTSHEDDDDEVESTCLAARVVLELGVRLSPLQALRVVPYLLERGAAQRGEVYAAVTSSLDKLESTAPAPSPPTTSSSSSYNDVLDRLPLVAHFPLDTPFTAHAPLLPSRVGAVRLNVIGGDSSKTSIFSPHAFLAAGFEESLNPDASSSPSSSSFSVEAWVSLPSSSRGGGGVPGTIVASCMQAVEGKEAFRGYSLECHRSNDDDDEVVVWTFRYGAYVASGRTRLARPGPGVEEEEEEEEYSATASAAAAAITKKKKSDDDDESMLRLLLKSGGNGDGDDASSSSRFARYVHLVGVHSQGDNSTVRLFVDGQLAESVAVAGGAPLSNVDAPLFVGGGGGMMSHHQVPFFCRLRDVAFYSAALSASDVAEHWGASTLSHLLRDTSSNSSSDDNDEEDDDDAPFRVVRFLANNNNKGGAPVALDSAAATDLALLLSRLLQQHNNSQRVVERALRMISFGARSLPPPLELELIQQLAAAEPSSVVAAGVLAAAYARSPPSEEEERVPIALAQFVRRQAEFDDDDDDDDGDCALVLDALLAYTHRASSTPRGVEQVLECALDALLVLLSHGSSSTDVAARLWQLAHSLLCLMLARSLDLPGHLASKCLALAASSSSSSSSSSLQPGNRADFECCLAELVCVSAFDDGSSNTAAVAGNHHHDFLDLLRGESVEDSASFLSAWFDKTLRVLPLPPIHSVRIRGKPFEQPVLAALASCFTVLLVHLLQCCGDEGRRRRQRGGLALRCMRYSWQLIGFLIHNKQGLAAEEAARRVQAVCRAFKASALPLPGDGEDELLLVEAAETDDDDDSDDDDEEEDWEETEKQRVLSCITVLAERDDGSTLAAIQARIRHVDQHQTRKSESLLLLAELSRTASSVARTWIMTRVLLNRDEGSVAAEETGGLVSALLERSSGVEEDESGLLALAVCRKHLALAPSSVVDLCVAKIEEAAAATAPTTSRSEIDFRFGNDALDLYYGYWPRRTLPAHAASSSSPHFVSASSPGIITGSIAVRCSHALHSGQLYFELWVADQDDALVRVGLVASSSSSSDKMVCGCVASVNGRGGGRVGVLVDLTANGGGGGGGMLRVFHLDGASDDQIRLVPSQHLVFECAIPALAPRPLTPAVCVLTSQASVRYSFPSLPPPLLLVERPPSVPHQQQQQENDEEEEEEEEPVARFLPVVGVLVGPLGAKFAPHPQQRVLACGQNAFGELGLAADQLSSRKRLTETSALVSDLLPCAIAAGNEFSAVLTSQGHVYVWGMNTKSQCAQPTTEAAARAVLMPTLVRQLQSRVVTRLCCQNGSENVFAICGGTGEAFAWGFNRFGNLGLGHLEESVPEPTRVALVGDEAMGAVVDVANGYSHTLLLTSKGRVHASGLNSHGQLGQGGTGGDIRPFFAPVHSSETTTQATASSVAVGLLHSVFVDAASGELWVFGRNDSGQLGLGHNTSATTAPVRLAQPTTTTTTTTGGVGRVEKVACGYHFTLVSTAAGELWAFGRNDAGQLGLGHTRECAEPQLVLRVGQGGRVSALSCGSGHWICSTNTGRVFTCGRNKAGATGDGTQTNRTVPLEMDLSAQLAASEASSSSLARSPQPLQVCQVAAGFHHTLVLVAAPNEAWFDSEHQLQQQQETAVAYKDFVLACCSRAEGDDPCAEAAKTWLLQRVQQQSAAGKKSLLPYLLALPSSSLQWWCEKEEDDWVTMLSLCLEWVFSDDDKDDAEDAGLVAALEWLLRLTSSPSPPASAAEVVASRRTDVVRRLLVLASRRSSTQALAIASHAVYVLRSWLADDDVAWVDFALLHECLTSFSSDELALGVVSVLGGELEVVRRGGKVRAMQGGGGGNGVEGVDRARAGRVLWCASPRRSGGGGVLAKIQLDDDDAAVFATRLGVEEWVAESRCGVPGSSSFPEPLFEALVCLAKQQQPHQPLPGGLQVAACKAVTVLLGKFPALVVGFVQRGHLHFFTSMLGSHALDNFTGSQAALEQSYTALLVAAGGSSGDPAPAAAGAVAVVSDNGGRSVAKKQADSSSAPPPVVIRLDLAQWPYSRCERVDAIDLEINHQLVPVKARDDDDDDEGDDPSVDIFYFSSSSAAPLMLHSAYPPSFTLLLDVMLLGYPTSSSSDEEDFVPGWTLTPTGHLVSSSTSSITSSAPLPLHRLVRLAVCRTDDTSQVFIDGVLLVSSSPDATAAASPLGMMGRVTDFVLTSAQLRVGYALSNDEIRVLGRASGSGIPSPSLFDDANGLRDQLHLPLAWCALALDKCHGERTQAKLVLESAKPALLRQASAHVEYLRDELGFDSEACEQAVCSTTSLLDCVGLLIDLEEEDGGGGRQSSVIDPFEAKAVSALHTSLTRGALARHARLAVVGRREAQEQQLAVRGELVVLRPSPAVAAGASGDAADLEPRRNDTFTLQASSKPTTTKRQQQPQQPPHSAATTTTTTGTLEQVERTLFALHARSAIVRVLDTDSRNALLGGNRYFVRDYLRAFQASDLTTTGDSNDYDPQHEEQQQQQQQHPARVLRRRLLSLVHAEAAECLTTALQRAEEAARVLPPHLQAGERRRVQLKCERRAWDLSVCRSLLQILLAHFGRGGGGGAGKAEAEEDEVCVLDSRLQVAPARAFRVIGRLASSSSAAAAAATTGEDDDGLIVYRPLAPVSGFYSLGDVVGLPASGEVRMASGGADDLTTSSLSPLLAKPVRYERVRESGDVVLWRPVPPPGYATLGLVACKPDQPPPSQQDDDEEENDDHIVRCVHVSCLAPAALRGRVMLEQDNLLWTVDNACGGTLSADEVDAEWKASPPPLQKTESSEDSVDGILDAWLELVDAAPARAQFVQRVTDQAPHRILPLTLAHHRRHCSTTTTTTNNMDAAFWLLFLLVEMMETTAAGEVWRERAFPSPLVRALLRLTTANNSSTTHLHVQATRALAAIATPATALKFPHEFVQLRRSARILHDAERTENGGSGSTSDQDLMPPMSASLCALMELLVEAATAARANDESDSGEEEGGGEHALRELAGVMDALLPSSSSSFFPDEFLMAEDGFLKLTRPEDTKIVTSGSVHPYTLSAGVVQGRCEIPHAQSLILRFDPRCETRYEDALGLMLGDNEEEEEEEYLQGAFGGSLIQVRGGNQFAYRFPVRQRMNWCLSSTVRGANIKLTPEAASSLPNLTATMRKDKTWETCCATRGFSRGIHSWETQVERCTSSANIFFGITKRPFADSYVGCNDYSWGFIGCCALWTGGRKYKQFGDRLKQGDVVRVTVDFYKRTLQFAINGVDQGAAFERLPIGGDDAGGELVYPAFSFFNKHDAITVLRGSAAAVT